MTRYIGLRLGYALLVVWAAYTVSFVLLYLLPSDPVQIMLASSSTGVESDRELQEAALRAYYGFDKPVVVQYFLLLGRALTGDFGASIQSGKPVVVAIGEVLAPTMQLTGLGLLIALLAGTLVAYLAVTVRSRSVAAVLASLPALSTAIPTFWFGLMILQIFSFRLGWIPALGGNGPVALIAPAIVIAIPSSALFAQVLIKSFGDVMRQPFIDVVRTKGVSAFRVNVTHGLRNAVLPVMTVLGLAVGGLVSGAVVTETVFSRGGVGRLLQNSVNLQDIPVVQGVVVLSAAFYAFANLAVDVTYPVVDPRIRLELQGRGGSKRISAPGQSEQASVT